MPLNGTPMDYAVVFLSGVLVSFTPCVYPVLPLTASFIAAANVKGTKLGGLVLSLVYVLGVAVTYCFLGALAVLTGKVFGSLQNTAGFQFLTAGLLVFFALVMLDKISLPAIGLNFQGRTRPRNAWTVLFLGAVSGLIVGPCTAPVLGTLLLYVGSKQNLVHAVSLLFVFSYGVGASLIVVGTFSGLLSRLPKSGPWLLRVKQLCAAVLLVTSFVLFYRAILCLVPPDPDLQPVMQKETTHSP